MSQPNRNSLHQNGTTVGRRRRPDSDDHHHHLLRPATTNRLVEDGTAVSDYTEITVEEDEEQQDTHQLDPPTSSIRSTESRDDDENEFKDEEAYDSAMPQEYFDDDDNNMNHAAYEPYPEDYPARPGAHEADGAMAPMISFVPRPSAAAAAGMDEDTSTLSMGMDTLQQINHYGSAMAAHGAPYHPSTTTAPVAATRSTPPRPGLVIQQPVSSTNQPPFQSSSSSSSSAQRHQLSTIHNASPNSSSNHSPPELSIEDSVFLAHFRNMTSQPSPDNNHRIFTNNSNQSSPEPQDRSHRGVLTTTYQQQQQTKDQVPPLLRTAQDPPAATPRGGGAAVAHSATTGRRSHLWSTAPTPSSQQAPRPQPQPGTPTQNGGRRGAVPPPPSSRSQHPPSRGGGGGGRPLPSHSDPTIQLASSRPRVSSHNSPAAVDVELSTQVAERRPGGGSPPQQASPNAFPLYSPEPLPDDEQESFLESSSQYTSSRGGHRKQVTIVCAIGLAFAIGILMTVAAVGGMVWFVPLITNQNDDNDTNRTEPLGPTMAPSASPSRQEGVVDMELEQAFPFLNDDTTNTGDGWTTSVALSDSLLVLGTVDGTVLTYQKQTSTTSGDMATWTLVQQMEHFVYCADMELITDPSNDKVYLVVGDPDSGNAGSGAALVYAFDRNYNVWQELGISLVGISADDPTTTNGGDSQFGTSVSVSLTPNPRNPNQMEPRLVVGAPEHTNNDGTPLAGRVMVYHYQESTVNNFEWTPDTSFTLNGVVANGRFGMAVDINPDGTTLGVGAPGDSSFYLYEWDGTQWTQALHRQYPTELDLGQSVTFLSNTLVAVGAPSAQNNRGTIRSWYKDETDHTWKELDQVLVGVQQGDRLGKTASLAGGSVGGNQDTLLVAVTDSGRVHRYDFDSATKRFAQRFELILGAMPSALAILTPQQTTTNTNRSPFKVLVGFEGTNAPAAATLFTTTSQESGSVPTPPQPTPLPTGTPIQSPIVTTALPTREENEEVVITAPDDDPVETDSPMQHVTLAPTTVLTQPSLSPIVSSSSTTAPQSATPQPPPSSSSPVSQPPSPSVVAPVSQPPSASPLVAPTSAPSSPVTPSPPITPTRAPTPAPMAGPTPPPSPSPTVMPTPAQPAAWYLVGWSLTTTSSGTGYGTAVALAQDLVVVAEPLQSNGGQVHIYRRESTTRSSPATPNSDGSTMDEWILLDTIVDLTALEFGSAVDVSMVAGQASVVMGARETRDTGDVAHFGSVHYYEYSTTSGSSNPYTNLQPVGSRMAPPVSVYETGGQFGSTVAMARTSNRRIAMGAPASGDFGKAKAGRVYTYEYDGSQWQPMTAQPLVGDAGFRLGTSLTMSREGDRIFVGAPAGHQQDGSVFYYEWNDQAGEWESIFSLRGQTSQEQAGTSVAILNDSGSLIAFGGPSYNVHQGVIRVFSDIGGGFFVQRGPDIVGLDQERIGTTLCGAQNRIGFGTATGSWYVYEYNGTDQWVSVATTEPTNNVGAAVVSMDMSHDGTMVVLGFANEEVHVYELR